MRAYLDESGDEGTKGNGTRWLAFGCALLPSSSCEAAAQRISLTLKRMGKPGKHIHFNELRHDDKRGVLDSLCQCDWAAVIVASDTTKIREGSRLAQPEAQFNYPLRYAVERVTQFADAIGENVEEIVLEERRGLTEARVTDYLGRIRDTGQAGMVWERLAGTSISVRPKHEEPLLSIADGLAHAAFRALEPDRRWGLRETTYLRMVSGRLWGGRETVRNVRRSGFVLMPTSEFSNFRAEYPWLDEILAP